MLSDSFERKFTYLRLSVTDICNFKCSYCLPNGYTKPVSETEDELSLFELKNLLHGFAHAGFKKVRLTGGEPTTRSDLVQIIEMAAEMNSFSKIALSTNAWNLKKNAALYRLAGLTHLNVSVDSLNPRRFHQLTGCDKLNEVLTGIDTALENQFSAIKINSVLHRENSDEEFSLFLDWIKDRPVSVRFIELMKTRDHLAYNDQHFLSAGSLKQRLLASGWKMVARSQEDGPAMEFSHPDYQGRMGIIAPYSQDFCASCNRLRITSRGKLRLCLFGDEDHSIRDYLQSTELSEQLPAQIQKLLGLKEVSHFLGDGKMGNVKNFSVMGG